MQSVRVAGKHLSLLRLHRDYRDDAVVEHWLARDEFGLLQSLQIITGEHELSPKDAWNSIRGSSSTPLFDLHGEGGQLEFGGSSKSYWLEDWVHGTRLRALLTSDKYVFRVTDLDSLIKFFDDALALLEERGLSHNNITDETIVLAQPSTGSYQQLSSWKLVNFARASKSADHRADQLAAASITAAAINSLLSRTLTPRERKHCEHVAAQLVAADARIRSGEPLRPGDFAQIVKETPKGADQADAFRLRTPFEAISAENLKSEALLTSLFSSSLPGLSTALEPISTLIQGPRGCGKSMLLRWISLKAKMASPDPRAALEHSELVGFYVSCVSAFQARMHAFDDASLGEARTRRSVVHYLNCLFAVEVVSSFRKADASGLIANLDEDVAQTVYHFLARALGEQSALQSGVDAWRQCEDLVRRALNQVVDALEGRAKEWPVATGGLFLDELTSLLNDRIPYLRQRTIAFCLDDYTEKRVPQAVQRVLNTIVLGVRSPNYVFKVSSEYLGVIGETGGGARVDFLREFGEVVNLGNEFMSGGQLSRQFTEEVLDGRLQQAGWSGRAATLLGDESLTPGEQATALVEDRNSPVYYGIDCLTRLCSGDLANMIFLFKTIAEEAELTATDTAPIAPSVQDRAIRRASRFLRSILPTFSPGGREMARIAEVFGDLAVAELLDPSGVQEHGAIVPRRKTRIEIDGVAVDVEDPFGDDLHTEVLRRGVFIRISDGNARRNVSGARVRGVPSPGQSVRLEFGPVYLPSFGLPIGKNIAWVWTRDNYLNFLHNPAEMAAKFRSSRSAHRRVSVDQLPLVGMEEGDETN